MSSVVRARVVDFTLREANCIRVGQTRYVVAQLKGGPPQMVDTRCPHRGGPLHLGQIQESGDRIVCPMHRLAIPLARLERSALPMIVRRDRVTVVVPAAESDAEAPSLRKILTTIGSTRFADPTTGGLAQERVNEYGSRGH